MYIFCTCNIFADICQINFNLLSVFPTPNIYSVRKKHIIMICIFYALNDVKRRAASAARHFFCYQPRVL